MKFIFPFLLLPAFPSLLFSAEIQQGKKAGCLFGPAEKVPEDRKGGFSFYSAEWSLVETGHEHKANHAQGHTGPAPKKAISPH